MSAPRTHEPRSPFGRNLRRADPEALYYCCKCYFCFFFLNRKLLYLTDINVCLPSPCDPNAVCQNTIGSLEFSCRCNAGFIGDGFSCTGKIKNRVNDTTFSSCHFYSNTYLVRYHLVRLCRDLILTKIS